MSNWKVKSLNNFKASEELISNNLHNESVHCSYYSCVQYVFHVLCDFCGMEVQDIETQSQFKYNRIGTHPWVQNQIFESLQNKSHEDAVSIYNEIGKLCQTRVRADYKHSITGKEDASKAYKKAEYILNKLKHHYDV